MHRYTERKKRKKKREKGNEIKYMYIERERERGREKKEKMHDRKRSQFVERIKMDATGGVFWISLFSTRTITFRMLGEGEGGTWYLLKFPWPLFQRFKSYWVFHWLSRKERRECDKLLQSPLPFQRIGEYSARLTFFDLWLDVSIQRHRYPFSLGEVSKDIEIGAGGKDCGVIKRD